MKFGIEIGSQSLHDIIRVSKVAEDSGFSSIWIADHVPAYMWRDPFVAMTAIGLNTQNIRIGCGVANPYSRHAGIIGVTFASMAELLGERLVLGLGAGGTLPLRPLDIEMWNKPVTAIRESIQVLRTLFSGAPVNYTGSIVTLKDTKLFGKYNIPIHIGTRGPALSKLAGEMADGIILNPPLDALPVYLEKVHEGMKESNKRPFEVVEFLPIGISNEGKYDTVKPTVALLVPTTPQWALELISAEEQAALIAEMLKVDRARAAEMVPDNLVTSFAIAGDVRSCIEQIEAIQQDVDELVALAPKSTDDAIELVSLFKEHIIPSF
jgi:5,10-methylenetetrahydromethanopterin reductase